MMDADDVGDTGKLNFPLSSYKLPNEIGKTNQLSIMSVNVQSMNNKFQEIRDIVHSISPTVLCLQEVWGRNSTKDYSIKHYHKPLIITRKGESMNLGGGVAIWVKEGMDFEQAKSPFKDRDIESCCITLPSEKLIITSIYRPFGDKHYFQASLYEHIRAKLVEYPGHKHIICGDFNYDLQNLCVDGESMFEMLLQEGFHQSVTEPTRITESSSTLIDHVYSNMDNPPKTDIVMAGISDHEITYTILPKRVKHKKEFVTKRWFKPSHYVDIANLIGDTDWSKMVKMKAEEAAIFLEKVITKALDEVAPVKTKKVSTKKINQWSTIGIITSTKNSYQLYKSVKKKQLLKEEYKEYKKVLQRVIRKAKNDYYDKRVKDAGNDTRKIWGIVNEVIDRKQSRHTNPATFILKGQALNTQEGIANGFNNYFASIGEEMADSLPTVTGYEEYLQNTPFRFRLEPVEATDIEEIMKKQQPKMSCGLDSINNKIVKTASLQLATPMSIIVNKSIREGYVPSIYKIARIVPLYKKGPTNDCGNYRPVSLLPSLSKIIEKAICAQLMKYLNTHQLLCDDQFGFRRRNQTTHVLQSMLNSITENSIKDEVTIATYIDLSKAFDCLQYNQLFSKMESLGFTDRTKKWFISYLSGRKQRTDFMGTISQELDVKLGVPQGSILGPILFLIYVNDINKSCPDAKFIKFADDTTILTSAPTLEGAASKMNEALIKVDLWFKRNKLNLNPDKTRYMIFNCKTDETKVVHVNSKYIERVWEKGKEKSFKLVGIKVDEGLKWTHHINHVASKINSAIYALKKSSKELSVSNKKLLYSGIVHSHLVYGLPIWGFATQGRLNKLLIKQKLAIRKIYNLKYLEHTLYYFVKAQILRLPELIKYMTLSYVKAGLVSPFHVQKLWTRVSSTRGTGRYSDKLLHYEATHKQWLHNLAPIAQVKLWNQYIHEGMKTVVTDLTFKQNIKLEFLFGYRDTLEEQGINIAGLLSESESLNNFPHETSLSR